MRERRKSKEKISGNGAKVKGKWPYYDVMKCLEYCLQRRMEYCLQCRTMEMFQRQQLRLQLKFRSLIHMKLKWAILNNWKEKI